MKELKAVLGLLSAEFPDIVGIAHDGYLEKEYGTNFLKKVSGNKYTDKAWSLGLDMFYDVAKPGSTEKLLEVRKLESGWVLFLMNNMYEERIIPII